MCYLYFCCIVKQEKIDISGHAVVDWIGSTFVLYIKSIETDHMQLISSSFLLLYAVYSTIKIIITKMH